MSETSLNKVADMLHCVRCGKHHKALLFYPPAGNKGSWYAICPETKKLIYFPEPPAGAREPGVKA